MATTKFNNNILLAARRLKDRRTDASVNGDTGQRYSSALLTNYQNKAIKELLREKFAEIGAAEFMRAFPELVKTSGVLTLTAGVVAKPSDAFLVIDLDSSDYAVHFDVLEQSEVQRVRSGADPLKAPSATLPVFWDENGSINTLGLTTGSVVARYIVKPDDLAVITSAAGNGKKNSANGQYTTATKLLQATMSTGFASGDENRVVMFYDNAAGKVYYGTIASVKDADEVYLSGDGLPAADIAAGNVTIVLMEQLQDADVKLNALWFGNIVDRMVQYGLADAQAGIVSGNNA